MNQGFISLPPYETASYPIYLQVISSHEYLVYANPFLTYFPAGC